MTIIINKILRIKSMYIRIPYMPISGSTSYIIINKLVDLTSYLNTKLLECYKLKT